MIGKATVTIFIYCALTGRTNRNGRADARMTKDGDPDSVTQKPDGRISDPHSESVLVRFINAYWYSAEG